MFTHQYKDIIKIENLLETWLRFLRGKRHKKDVMFFGERLAENLSLLHRELGQKKYVHGPYSEFNVADPKPRRIHKSSVRDRLVHHLIYEALYPYFELRFVYDSYSCRKDKGTHKALARFRDFGALVSKNNTRTCYILKCDVRKFFANIDQKILLEILKRHIADEDILWLVQQVVSSFHADRSDIGLPLGNLTSQLLVNVYMHEFDRYVKQELGVRYYIRYADDFLVFSDDKKYLENLLSKIQKFLYEKLHLTLHSDKVFIKTYASGVDFLGWVHFPNYRQLRTTTKRRLMRKMKWYPTHESINSYQGLLQYGNTYKIQKQIGFTSLHS